MFAPADFFDLSNTLVAQAFAECAFVWEAVGRLATYVGALTRGKQQIQGEVMEGAYIGDQPLFIGRGARIEPGAYVAGPAYIGDGCVVRHGAFVRENVVLLAGSVLGHASEAKNSLFLPGAHAPHFNYIGDSILGHGVNLGAGTKLSNLTLVSEKNAHGERPHIILEHDGHDYDTGLAKLGAILGDGAQTGCNAVLNPGCLVGPGSLVYANLSLRKGYYPARTIFKLRQTLEQTTRR
jgi:NDP-sugar pyrophosphorylase family protein